MRQMLCFLLCVSMVTLFVACNRSSEPQPAAEGQAQQAPAPETTTPETTPPPPKQAEPAPEPVAPPTAKPKPQTTQPAATTPPVAEKQAETAPAVKVKKAGLGIIFKGNIEKGTFRVKAGDALIYELAFSGKDTDAAKEFYLEPGEKLMKFVVIDDKGVRGVKEETMNFVSGRHQTVRVSVKDTPGAIIVEHLE